MPTLSELLTDQEKRSTVLPANNIDISKEVRDLTVYDLHILFMALLWEKDLLAPEKGTTVSIAFAELAHRAKLKNETIF